MVVGSAQWELVGAHGEGTDAADPFPPSSAPPHLYMLDK